VAAILTGLTDASASDSIAWLRKLRADLRIPPLGAYGVRREHIRELCEKASVASSMKANPITLEPKELKLILESAL
jgi:alcohol dehydrogenase class IV